MFFFVNFGFALNGTGNETFREYKQYNSLLNSTKTSERKQNVFVLCRNIRGERNFVVSFRSKASIQFSFSISMTLLFSKSWQEDSIVLASFSEELREDGVAERPLKI